MNAQPSKKPDSSGTPGARERSARELFDQWRKEDHELEQALEELQNWMLQVNQMGSAHFSETAQRLAAFRLALLFHFDREDALCDELSTLYDKPCPEVEGACRQAKLDHANLLDRIDALIDKLNALEPPPETWQQVIQEVDCLIDAVEQHEEQEAESVSVLMGLED